MARTEAPAADLDLICVGRAAVDLYGDQLGAPLEDVSTFSKSLGGCAANIAVGAARQGLRVGMLTRVGDEAMGRFVKETLQSEGVDTRAVTVDPGRLTGLVLLSVRDRETFPLVFYRTDCADMALDADLVDPDYVARARAVLLTGTHLSTQKVRAASWAALRAAKAAGRKVVLDVDYRPVLWRLTGHDRGEDRYVPSAEVSAVVQEVLPECDLVVGTEEELRLAGGHDDLQEALRYIRARTSATLVLKRGQRGCVVFEGEIPERLEDGLVGEAFEVDVLNVLGAGDAFMAGFLRGWLEEANLSTAARYGNACGALVVSRHACAPAIPTRRELDAYLGKPDRGRIDQDADVGRLHWVSTRPDGGLTGARALCVLAFDHRVQLEALDVAPERLEVLKDRIADGLEAARAKWQGAPVRFGAIVDAQYGRAALDRFTAPGAPWWIARPIEKAADPSLGFLGDPNVELELSRWPEAHVVKCLVHPVRCDHALTAWQHARLVRLSTACRAMRRRLLVEVLPRERPGAPVDPELLPELLEEIYALGVRPDWWKLPPPRDDDGWSALDKIVRASDPDCRGVLVLGLDAPRDVLREGLGRAAAHPLCRGFAVGRSIFFASAKRWLNEELGDAELVAEVQERLTDLLTAYIEGKEDGS